MSVVDSAASAAQALYERALEFLVDRARCSQPS